MTEHTYNSESVADTERIAGELSRLMHGGECLALEGDLGAGKTQFVRGLVKGLGGDGRAVSSPTYVLLHVYGSPESANPSPQRLTVYHLDAYRVSGSDELEAIGFTELLEQGGVVVVEWPSRVPELLPASTWRVTITSTGETSRLIVVQQP